MKTKDKINEKSTSLTNVPTYKRFYRRENLNEEVLANYTPPLGSANLLLGYVVYSGIKVTFLPGP